MQFEKQKTSENYLVEALRDSSLLLLFLVPWSLASITALGYVELQIFMSFFGVENAFEVFTKFVGFVAVIPWFYFAGKMTTVTLFTCYHSIKNNRDWRHGWMEWIETWTPKSPIEIVKYQAGFLCWILFSLPFSFLLYDMLLHNQV